ncbi:hypothetical protein LO762_26125 [Actinocorallia sp. API 0066]|uniref:LppU/SCO3897 family protein n=1 Tax=Actinocorallia sp. API 0066 TaxID=2896846 RepID=UPI001E43B927|nr:hypothetical protein [Actinocorallia sp. API 0066]MCD0452633.1 hypothetical protein [Actinocorallia sp. API 0066]
MIKKILSVLALLAMGGCSYLAVQAALASPDRAKSGDCVRNTGGQNVELVDCADPAADYRIVGRVPNKTRVQAQVNAASICASFTDAQTFFWRGEEGKPGYVLCLAPAH